MATKFPAMMFYVGDWLKDTALRTCSPAARGVYIDILCFMFESETRGVLRQKVNQNSTKTVPIPIKTVLKMVACAKPKHVQELIEKGVLRVSRKDGALYSKRMIRDELRRRHLSARARSGGVAKACQTRAKPVLNPCYAGARAGASSSSTSSSTSESASSATVHLLRKETQTPSASELAPEATPTFVAEHGTDNADPAKTENTDEEVSCSLGNRCTGTDDTDEDEAGKDGDGNGEPSKRKAEALVRLFLRSDLTPSQLRQYGAFGIHTILKHVGIDDAGWRTAVATNMQYNPEQIPDLIDVLGTMAIKGDAIQNPGAYLRTGLKQKGMTI